MKVRTLSQYGLALLIGLYSLIVISIPAKAAPNSVYIDPATISVQQNDTFTVDVRADTADSDAAQININYPSASLDLVSYDRTGSVFANETGLVNNPGDFQLSLFKNGGDPNVTGDVFLLTLTFDALVGSGNATIDVLATSRTLLAGVDVTSGTGDSVVSFSSTTPPPTPDPGPTEDTYSDSQPGTDLSLGSGYTAIVNGVRGNVSMTCGILKGIGTVANIAMSCGKVAPGLSPGILNSGSVTYTGGEFEVELGGTTPGNTASNHDQLNVTGTVDLGTATTLSVIHWNGFLAALNDQFVIINNDGTDAVTGNFQGLAQGATLTVDGIEYTISYTGGDGNDVVLTATSVPTTPTTPETGFEQVKNYAPLALLTTIIALAAVVVSRKSINRI